MDPQVLLDRGTRRILAILISVQAFLIAFLAYQHILCIRPTSHLFLLTIVVIGLTFISGLLYSTFWIIWKNATVVRHNLPSTRRIAGGR